MGQSPATILFARKLKDGMPVAPGTLALRKEWILNAQQRELALAKNHLRYTEIWSRLSRDKSELVPGQLVSIQNQTGKNKLKWDIVGTIVENLGHSSYLIKLDGLGRISKRRRQFLRPIDPYMDREKILGAEVEEISEDKENDLRRSRRIIEKSKKGEGS